MGHAAWPGVLLGISMKHRQWTMDRGGQIWGCVGAGRRQTIVLESICYLLSFILYLTAMTEAKPTAATGPNPWSARGVLVGIDGLVVAEHGSDLRKS
jgi:hypothetical protein